MKYLFLLMLLVGCATTRDDSVYSLVSCKVEDSTCRVLMTRIDKESCESLRMKLDIPSVETKDLYQCVK